MATLSAPPSGLRPRTIRNPAPLRAKMAQSKSETAGPRLFETLALGFVLTAVAGVLPLVMYLRG